MDLTKYDYKADPTGLNFTFQSEGPQGIIKKVVRYQKVAVLNIELPVINLAFGDSTDDGGAINDAVISNNQDRDKVLATVALTVIEFTDKHGKLPVYAIGSTPAKTRLYQMALNAHIAEVEKLFFLYGRLNNDWVKFESGINYDAFLAIRK